MKAEIYKLSSTTDLGTITKSLQRVLNSNVKDKGEKIGVLIQNEQAIRNTKQNSLIHVLFQRISDATASIGKGDRTPMPEIKAMLKDKFLGYKSYKLKNKIIYELKSTSKLTKKECSEFTKNIRRTTLSGISR